MNIFEITADQITRLKDYQLVELLQRLITAELTKNRIPLSAGVAPAQITIADGGEDGRVEWHAGPARTDFLPSRYTIFQCKKSDPGPSGLKKETWTKSSQGKDQKREINKALAQALDKRGAYLLVIGSPIVGTKLKARTDAILEGIREAGENPLKLSQIEIIEANKLVLWTNSHPPIALWVNSKLRDIHLHGFRDYDDWSSDSETFKTSIQCLNEERFFLRGAPLRQWEKEQVDIKELQSITSLKETLTHFLKNHGCSIRIVGPSGYGKTRLAHALLDITKEPTILFDSKQVVYATYEDVQNNVVNVARELAQSGSRCILVIDDCPDAIHMRLWEAINRGNTSTTLITIGIETKSIAIEKNLVIEAQPASNELIEQIAKSILKEKSNLNTTYIRELAQGFPSMAVLSAHAIKDGDQMLTSVKSLVDRIVWGNKESDDEALFALQTLSLFTVVGVENGPSKELADIANFIDRKPNDLFRFFRNFQERGIIVRLGDYAEVRPTPLAMHLANDWLASMPRGTLERFFRELKPELQLRLAGRLRWVSWSAKVSHAADQLLEELLPTRDHLNTAHGSKLLDRFVHIAPDRVMDQLKLLLGALTVNDLIGFEEGRRHTVWALEKLSFRKETFAEAAMLLLKLGAAENENWGNNATGQFKSLFKLQLSGTEAEPSLKLEVLDQGLKSPELKIRKLCVDALESMLTTHHFSRSGGQDQIGYSQPLTDWHPTTYAEIFDYYRSALNRLERIALDDSDPFQEIALSHIGDHLRGLIKISALFEDIEKIIDKIKYRNPRWHAGLSATSSWLYFDQQNAPQEYRDKVRALHDRLIPNDHIEKILIYSTGWGLSLHNPDIPYKSDIENDHNYAERMARELIQKGPKNTEHYKSLLAAFAATGKYHNSGPTLISIVRHVNDPENLLNQIFELLDSKTHNNDTVAELLRNALSGLSKVDIDLAREQLKKAIHIDYLKPNTVDLASSVGVDDEIFSLLIERLRIGEVSPSSAQRLGFRTISKDVSPTLIHELITVLISLGTQGAWAAVDFLNYFFYEKKEISEQEANLIKIAVTQPNLLNKERFENMDAHHWQELITKLFSNNLFDEAFAKNCTSFIASIVDLPNYSVQLQIDEYAREIIRKIIDFYPETAWQIYTDLLKSSNHIKTYRISGLFGTEIGTPAHAGVLDLIPMNIVEPWMLEDRKDRLRIVLEWINIFENNEVNGNWDSKFLSFIEKHVRDTEEMNPIASRLTAGSWIGSYTSKLNPILEQIEKLRKLINNPAVNRWTTQMRQSLVRSIEIAQREDENRDAGYRA